MSNTENERVDDPQYEHVEDVEAADVIQASPYPADDESVKQDEVDDDG